MAERNRLPVPNAVRPVLIRFGLGLGFGFGVCVEVAPSTKMPSTALADQGKLTQGA
ncbi:MAG: hypothetical protein WDO74_30410 [Pseudomonadota bacterium]